MTYGIVSYSGHQLIRGWNEVKLGAGGQVTDLSISADGVTQFCATDTAGAYRWNISTDRWDMIITGTTMPVGSVGKGTEITGTYAIQVAPNNSSVAYMAYSPYGAGAATTGTVYKSTNANTPGITWTATTALSGSPQWNPNDNYKFNGQKMAVDPSNANVVYISTPSNGNYFTIDGGTTWSAVPTVTGTSGVPNAIAFDASHGLTSGKTSYVYISVAGGLVWRSTDAGATWASVASSPTITANGSHIKISADGVVYVITAESIEFGSHLWRLQSGSWTDIYNAQANGNTTVVTTPTSGELILLSAGGVPNYSSTSYGSSWSVSGYLPGKTQSAGTGDPPWLAWAQNLSGQDFMSVGEAIWDATNSKMIMSGGIGVWDLTLPITTTPNYVSRSRGIENMVGNWAVSPPNGYPILTVWDRGAWTITNPATYTPLQIVTSGAPNGAYGPYPIGNAIEKADSVDWASSTPSFICVLNEVNGPWSGYSTDKGITWSLFPTAIGFNAAGLPGGSIAASSPNTIIAVPANNGAPKYTRDGGTTWTTIPGASFHSGIVDGTDSGWGFSSFLNRQILCADRVATDTFYIFNYHSVANGGGLYKITFPSGTLTITQVYSSLLASGFTTNNASLRSVPGYQGHMFFTAGQGDSTQLFRFIESGGTATPTARALVGETYAIGFGKIASGSDYPSVGFVGTYNGTFGTWISTSTAAQWLAGTETWTNITAGTVTGYPMDRPDFTTSLEGDANTVGTWYQVGKDLSMKYYTS